MIPAEATARPDVEHEAGTELTGLMSRISFTREPERLREADPTSLIAGASTR